MMPILNFLISEASGTVISSLSGSGRRRQKKKKRSGKIRAGSADEEDELVKHILQLGTRYCHIRYVIFLFSNLKYIIYVYDPDTLQVFRI